MSADGSCWLSKLLPQKIWEIVSCQYVNDSSRQKENGCKVNEFMLGVLSFAVKIFRK